MASIKEFDHLKIPLKDIKSATNSFGTENYIGGGGFGKVYRGELLLSDKLIMVAVKRLDSALGQGPPEFWKEIMMLSRYKHENLVSLLVVSEPKEDDGQAVKECYKEYIGVENTMREHRDRSMKGQEKWRRIAVELQE
nr:cytochrome b5-like heme/steroid binding domain-containing protein [Tanacetum cinerariifolium]